MLSVYGTRFGLDRETALRAAGAFGGGMARRGGTCGAVTGALMVIGLKYGKTKIDDDEPRERTYEAANRLVEEFCRRNKTEVCRELLGLDLNTEEGREAVAKQNLFVTLCPRFVRDAGEILEELLKD
jgi:C_GCAxxG_C_C family probable redox protein